MALDEVPAPGPDEQRCGMLAEAVRLALGRGEGEPAANGVPKRGLTADDVRPRWRERILEVGHERASPGVQGIDDHLRLRGPRDLDAPVEQVGGWLGHAPGGIEPDR